MLSLEDVNEICQRLSLEIMGRLEEDFSEDVSCIVYYHDICECGDVSIYHRHIDRTLGREGSRFLPDPCRASFPQKSIPII